MVLLKAQSVFDIVSGDNARPETGVDRTRWDKLDATAQKIIATSVKDSQLLHIMNCTNSKAMWDKLCSIYEKKNQTGIHILQQKWYQSAKNSSDNTAQHIAKMEDLAHRLRTLGEQISDFMIVTKILMTLRNVTLPENYNFFITVWESTADEQRTLSNLTERLVAEEMRLKNHEDSEDQALVAQKRFGKFSHDRNKNTKNDQHSNVKNKKPGACNYCKKPGH